ncbi:nicotinamide N-methyltransferase-like [Spea bombifrons]|uniref:nicotinamide N-methyltransferase-like n=1 Tax=Spea bombifrons TaxID=233779 RepID=UPI002349827F|nr:nicotinamide N-methyltransferase-like [Spea bombifrons]
MDPSHKHYHVHEFDTKEFFNRYFSAATDKVYCDEVLMFPMKELHKAVTPGDIRGEVLIDMSVGCSIHHLLPVSEYFKEIIVLEFSDACIKDLENWVKKGDDAFDLSHTSKFMTELQGTSDTWEEKEENLRKKIKHILKCDFTKENPTDPVVLPKADCVLSLYVKTIIAKDHETYINNLKKVSRMLKPGGHLLLLGGFNAKYYTIGKDKFHALTYNEEFIRKALTIAGFVIEHLEVQESQMRNENAYVGHVFFIKALKIKEADV